MKVENYFVYRNFMKNNIITKLKKSGLVGRGGACFPTWLKWDTVREAKGEKKYVICNASEGEPGVAKDGYILENYPERVIDGMKIAIDFLSSGSAENKPSVKAYIYINPAYYKKYAGKLKTIIGDAPIELYQKHENAGYIGGEETSAINSIEGKRIEPRLKPPFPTTDGLWGCPTLVNNVETFYSISLIAGGEYGNKRFYTINGDCLWNGVFYLDENWTIGKILKETGNYPDFNFFVQVGGEASGELLNSKQLRRPATGAAAITVYSVMKHRSLNLMKKWINWMFSYNISDYQFESQNS